MICGHTLKTKPKAAGRFRVTWLNSQIFESFEKFLWGLSRFLSSYFFDLIFIRPPTPTNFSHFSKMLHK